MRDGHDNHEDMTSFGTHRRLPIRNGRRDGKGGYSSLVNIIDHNMHNTYTNLTAPQVRDARTQDVPN